MKQRLVTQIQKTNSAGFPSYVLISFEDQTCVFHLEYLEKLEH